MLISSGDFSYSGDPSSSPLDQVRFLIGDTDEHDMILTDAEIEWIISKRGERNIYLPAMDAAELAGHKYTRVINRQTGTLNLSLGQGNPFMERARQLSLLAQDRVAPVFANDDAARAAASGRPPIFWLGMHDNYPSNPHGSPSDRGGSEVR